MASAACPVLYSEQQDGSSLAYSEHTRFANSHLQDFLPQPQFPRPGNKETRAAKAVWSPMAAENHTWQLNAGARKVVSVLDTQRVSKT